MVLFLWTDASFRETYFTSKKIIEMREEDKLSEKTFNFVKSKGQDTTDFNHKKMPKIPKITKNDRKMRFITQLLGSVLPLGKIKICKIYKKVYKIFTINSIFKSWDDHALFGT